MRRRLATAILAAELAFGLAAASVASAQGDGAAPTIEILAPLAAEIPVGDVPIRVFVRNARPGDTVDFFVDGRRIGTVAHEPWEVVWAAGQTLAGHVITVSLLRDGREISTARVNTRNPGFTARADPLVVALSPVVMDRSGNYVLGLGQKDFQVFDDGTPQRIETFDAVDSPLSVLLVLDVSASMQPKLDDATRAAQAFLRALKPDDRVGLVTFNSGIVTTLSPTLDRAAISAAIEAVIPDGETALYDAVAASLRDLKRAKQRKAIVLFTDGEDNRSRLSVGQVVEIARGSEVSIYAVAEGAPKSQVMRVLDRLSSETGGRAFAIGSIRSLSDSFGRIVQELRSQYFLTYTPSKRGPRSWHTVDVKVDRGGATVRAKKRYYSP